MLELYPALAAGGQSVLHNRTQAQLGLVLQTTADPQDCGDPTQGPAGLQRHACAATRATCRPIAPNVAAHCTAPASSGINVRGSANVPGGDPISATGGGVAYPRATTENTDRHRR